MFSLEDFFFFLLLLFLLDKGIVFHMQFFLNFLVIELMVEIEAGWMIIIRWKTGNVVRLLKETCDFGYVPGHGHVLVAPMMRNGRFF